MIERAGPRHGFGDCRFGNGVKGNALDLLGERLFLRQNFLHMPANGFAFAIRVRRKDQRVRALGLIGNGLQLLGLIGISFPGHGKAIVRID